MSTMKSIAKWAAIIIGFLILMAFLQDVPGYTRVGIGLAVYIGVLFHGLNKRLDVIDFQLRRLSAQIEDRS
ncbi:hypothetical protein LJR074_003219 [Acidovorax sp. LjRoot74]|uniref:hypothetical protein n=1 Tax=Acidovorax sp. LjRoot74 TaxID=3342337 RepID=UPI003ECE60DC